MRDPKPALQQLKKALVSNGFEVYRTLDASIVLAERVRDNLIMDSGVAAGPEPDWFVEVTVRAQRSDFPTESDDELKRRARQLAAQPLERGFAEIDGQRVPILDPGDHTRVLDVWHEVRLRRSVADLQQLISELRYALSLPKTTSQDRS